MSHVSHVKESCRTYERVTLHMIMIHVTHIAVMSRICMTQGLRGRAASRQMCVSCRTKKGGILHIGMGHVKRLSESYCNKEYVMSHIRGAAVSIQV